VITSTLTAILIFLFTIINIISILFFIRFLTGICQVFRLVYFPVWVDRYGKSASTMWLTFLQLGTPLGVFTGYALTALIQDVNFYK